METTYHMLIPRDITVKGVAELMIYRSKKSGLVEYMLKKARNIDLNLLRKKLSVIKESMSKDIISVREDRV